MNSKHQQLAEVLVSHSTKLKSGERVLIEAFDIPESLLETLIDRVVQAGAIPFVDTKHNRVLRKLYINASEEMMMRWASWEAERMQQMDAYIGIRGSNNALEMSDVPGERMKHYQTHIWGKVHRYRVDHTKWVVLRYPSSSFAQSAGMSSEAFEEFYYNVCTLDYAKMHQAQLPLQKRMLETDKVRLTGLNTDLEFSIKGIGAVICAGERNG